MQIVPPSESGPSGSLRTRVYFHYKNDDINFGECVKVVGDHPALGSWDPARSFELHTNEDIFPSWISAHPLFFELKAQVAYKYIIVQSDGTPRFWEEGENRKFTATGPEMTIEDDDGLYRLNHGVHDEEDWEEEEDEEEALHMKTRSLRKMDKEQRLAFVKDLEGDAQIQSTDTVFMVAFKLPVKVKRKAEGGWEVDHEAPLDGRNFAFLPLLEELRRKRKLKVVNVGWPGVIVENPRERAQLEKLLAEHDCIAIFPPNEEMDLFVRFCTGTLWPVFHDVTLYNQTPDDPRQFSMEGWAAYQHVNNLFAAAVVPTIHHGDLIWIHDYHMLMVPTFISRKVNKANIGLYLHAPFPSSDNFKALPVREELLSGMLSADQLGFQFFSYARNFLVSCKRIKGIDPVFKAGGFTGVLYNGREIMIKVAHFVYPFQDSKNLVCSDVVSAKAAEVKALFKDRVVFASMDRCDGLSGLVLKIRAFNQFLEAFPAYRGKAVLVQYCFESSAGYGTFADLTDALKSQAGGRLQVNAQGSLEIVKHDEGDPDIFLRFERVDRIDRLALFRAAHVLLDTSVKAGLNLMPFEFVTAHHDDSESRQSSIIVSEFSGCSRVMLGALRVNPWNTAQVVAACERVLRMETPEKQERHAANMRYIEDNSPMEWFEGFLQDLKRARKKENLRVESIGFGAKMRQICVNSDFRKLSIDEVLSGYRSSKNRVLFLDNEGTLAADIRHLYREYGAPKGDVSDLKSHGTAPDESVLECLRSLCSDSRNTVVILSGRNREMLEEWFSSVPRIGLAAERGFYYKLPIATGDQWHCMVSKPDNTWKSNAFEIMRQFVKRTQGSFIENKGSALVWQYRDADQHFGSWQAKELSSHLKELLFGWDVEVMEGKGYVEVKLRGINKGLACTKVLSKVTQAFGDVDFVLCLGDDRSDEDMFETVNTIIDPGEEVADTSSQLSTTDGESDSLSDRVGTQFNLAGLDRPSSGKLDRLTSGGLSSNRFFTCTVGRKPSAAKFYLDDTDEVSELLAGLKAQHEKRVKELDALSGTPTGGSLWSARSAFAKQGSMSATGFSDSRRLRPELRTAPSH